MIPAIVISAFNRPESLARLLNAIAQAEYPDDPVPLVISMDRGEDDRSVETCRVAEQFAWTHGPKRLIRHAAHLGLVQHVFFCAGLSHEYGAVIFLEDDLGISPVFYRYTTHALEFYEHDERIAGLCLYALWFNGYTRQPFFPIADGADAFFCQVPYTQGQAWTSAQWQRFEDWRAAGDRTLKPTDQLHDLFFQFDAEDWFPLLTKFVVETNRFYVYPRVSLTTGNGDIGTHFTQTTLFLQTPLLQSKDAFTFKPLDDSLAVYDSFFEIRPERLNRLTDALHGLDYAVDLYATKQPRHLRADYVLTARRTRAPIRSFGKALFPHEMNVVAQTPGTDIGLSKKNDLRWDWLAELETKKINHDYFTRREHLSRRLRLQFALLDRVRR